MEFTKLTTVLSHSLFGCLILLLGVDDIHGQSIREKADEIEARYDKLLQEADGVVAKQISAGKVRRAMYRQLVSSTAKSELDFNNIEDLLALGKAAEHAKMLKEAEFYSQKIISMAPAQSEGYALLLRLRFNQGDIDGAEKLLADALSKARDPEKFDGYIGILAFAMSQAERPELAIKYFEEYLDARADSISGSYQLFEILGDAIEHMALNSALLRNTDRFDEFLAAYLKRLEKNCAQEEVKFGKSISEYQLFWKAKYFVASMFLKSCSNEDFKVLDDFDSFIRFAYRHRSLPIGDEKYQEMLSVASAAAITTSCQWSDENIAEVLGVLERLHLLVKKNNDSQHPNIDALLLKSIEAVQFHASQFKKATQLVKNGIKFEETNKPQIIIWFNNNVDLLSKMNNEFRQIHEKGSGSLHLAFSDRSIESQLKSYIKNSGASQLKNPRVGCIMEPMYVEATVVEPKEFQIPIWIARTGGETSKVLQGGGFAKLKWILWFQISSDLQLEN